jgi:hypothetical protein
MVAGTWCVLWKVFLIASPWLPQPEVVALAQGRLMGSFLEQGMKRSDVEDVLGKKYVDTPDSYVAGFDSRGLYFGHRQLHRYDQFGLAVLIWNDKLERVRFKPWHRKAGRPKYDDWWNKDED